MRETEEEIGLKSCHIQILGMGSKIIPLSGPSIIPILGLVQKFDPNLLTRNKSEVESIFNVNIENLVKYKAHTQFKGGYSTPVFYGGKERIWGMTATITHLFLNSFFRDQYDFRIPYTKQYKNHVPNQKIESNQI